MLLDSVRCLNFAKNKWKLQNESAFCLFTIRMFTIYNWSAWVFIYEADMETSRARYTNIKNELFSYDFAYSSKFVFNLNKQKYKEYVGENSFRTQSVWSIIEINTYKLLNMFVFFEYSYCFKVLNYSVMIWKIGNNFFVLRIYLKKRFISPLVILIWLHQ